MLIDNSFRFTRPIALGTEIMMKTDHSALRVRSAYFAEDAVIALASTGLAAMAQEASPVPVECPDVDEIGVCDQ